MGLPPQMNDCLCDASVINVDEIDTTYADKILLNELITSLRSELNSANAVRQAKDDKITGLNRELSQRNAELKDMKQRLDHVEKGKRDDTNKVYSFLNLVKRKCIKLMFCQSFIRSNLWKRICAR